MRDAIKINRARQGTYARLTYGASWAISDRLITVEYLALAFTHIWRNFDGEAHPYQAKGINIVCDEFIDMKHTPQFRTQFENGSPLRESFVQLDPQQIKRNLELSLKQGGFSGIYAEAKRNIELLQAEPRLNCLMRHTFESIARVAALAPIHIARAQSLGLPSPEGLSMSLLRSHFFLTHDMIDLDRLALPIQVSGVPLLCQDVPPIPVP